MGQMNVGGMLIQSDDYRSNHRCLRCEARTEELIRCAGKPNAAKKLKETYRHRSQNQHMDAAIDHLGIKVDIFLEAY